MANLEISTVVGCKMLCSYCPQSLHVKKYAETNKNFVMSVNTFKTCLTKVPKEVEIVFAGMAEPWLNPDASSMLFHADTYGYRISVFTTCEGMTCADIYAYLSHVEFKHFCIHLPDQEGQMKLKVTEDYLEVVSECLRLIPNVTLMCIGTLHEKVRKVVGRDVPNGTRSLISRAGTVSGLGVEYKTGRLRCPPCGPNLDHNILLPNGDVLICCMDYGQEHVIGNLLENSYEDILKSNEHQRVLAGLNDESVKTICRKCEYAENFYENWTKGEL